jgi:superfamily I DNA/RNA helicase
LDEWEQKNIYDEELAMSLGCKSWRAEKIRRVYEAQWQTLDRQYPNQAGVGRDEIDQFEQFHADRAKLYSCVLPGEIVFKCVEAMRQGNLQPSQPRRIDNLIVDEFQDLNACDQEFVRLLGYHGAVLFVVGDDDQSIYSFRHAHPDGIVNLAKDCPSSTHILEECFRCTPAILEAASRLIKRNTQRFPKDLVSLYKDASPPVRGKLWVWSFETPQEEARAIALSCQELIKAGMARQEDEILILVSNRGLAEPIVQELNNLELPYDTPVRGNQASESNEIRAVYALLRIARDRAMDKQNQDYPAYRDILGVLSDVEARTAKAVGDECITNNQDFRELFYLTACPTWLTGQLASAVQRVRAIVETVGNWSMQDTLGSRRDDITAVLTKHICPSGANVPNNLEDWRTLAGELPKQMTLEELRRYLAASTESDQRAILDRVNQRVGSSARSNQPPTQKRIRILTMHGAKGLSGKVVFIPRAEQGVIPYRDTLQLEEQRRLFYVSVTRAKACCIISHAQVHTCQRSQFLDEMEVPSVPRKDGLTPEEADAIVHDIRNL